MDSGASANKAKPGRGRPPKYREDYHPGMAYKLTLLGVTDDQMADVFDIDQATLNRWKKKHSDFCESLTRGKIIADAEIAHSMFERAKGYQHKETKFFVVRDGKDSEKVVTEETVMQYPPDTKAAAIWLSNRTRNWREKIVDLPEKPDPSKNNNTSIGLTFTIVDPKNNIEIEIEDVGANEETV